MLHISLSTLISLSLIRLKGDAGVYPSTGFTEAEIVTSIHKTTTNPRHLFVNGLITNLEPWLLTHEGAREANMKNVPSPIQQSMTLDHIQSRSGSPRFLE